MALNTSKFWHFLIGRKVMTNLDSIFKTKNITLPTKIHLVKAMVFPVVMYGCDSWIVKKAERRRIDAFELWCWRRLLRVPLDCKEIQPVHFKEIPGLISFRMTGWISLQYKGTLKSLLQHHSSKPSILQRSAFFTVQLSHPYMTTGKTIALTRQTFVGKVMSLLFNMLSRLNITFLPRSKRLLRMEWFVSKKGHLS